MLLFLEKIIIFLCMNKNFRVELKPKAVELTGKAFEALEKIQLSEFEKAGYKKPYKVLASEAIMAYSPPSAKPASPQYTPTSPMPCSKSTAAKTRPQRPFTAASRRSSKSRSNPKSWKEAQNETEQGYSCEKLTAGKTEKRAKTMQMTTSQTCFCAATC
jgi:hypothetical protein